MNTKTISGSVLIPGLSGVAVFLLLQVFFSQTWMNLFAWAKVTQAWWLNSGRSIFVTLVVVFLATVAVLAVRRTSLLASSLAMMAGLAIGMTVALLAVGPGNLWPIVLVFGWGLLGVAVGLGTLTAWGLQWVRRSSEV